MPFWHLRATTHIRLILSCGVALQPLRLAIRAFGYAEIISILPDRAQPDLLARFRLCQQRQPAPDDALFSYIAERHTNRRQFEDRALPAELLQA